MKVGKDNSTTEKFYRILSGGMWHLLQVYNDEPGWLHIRLSFVLRSSARGSTNPTGGCRRVWVKFSSTIDYIIDTSIYRNYIPIW